jgi:malate dehydrogenase (oxaloacetate-decarboxylating)(NADP+)
MYVFPGIGLGSILCRAAHISQEMVSLPKFELNQSNIGQIYTSAVALSNTIQNSETEAGMLYPEITRIREVSVVVAREVIRQAQRERLDNEESIRDFSDEELDAWIKARMYDPTAQNGIMDVGEKPKL